MALDWFFGHILKSAQDRKLATANIVFLSEDPDIPTRVASIPRPNSKHSDEQYVALSFETLRDVVKTLPQHCLFGGQVVCTTMLPQGFATSVPWSILNACYQRYLKFVSPSVPRQVLQLLVEFSKIYIDDSLHCLPYLDGDDGTLAVVHDAQSELFGIGEYTHKPMYLPPIVMGLETDPKFLETNIYVFRRNHLIAMHRNPDVDATLESTLPANFRIVPFDMFGTDQARFGYVLGMLSRAETNTTFAMHKALAVLEMVVELQLHGWPAKFISAAVRKRMGQNHHGLYEIVLHLMRESQLH